MSEVFKTGRFKGFSVHDPFARAANNESPVVFNLGTISWPDGLAPTPLPIPSFHPGQVITKAVNFKVDVLVVLYTDLETRAFLDVFTGSNEWDSNRQAKWYLYGHNFAKFKSQIQGIDDSDALKKGAFGYLSAVQIGDQKVAIYKTELHAKVNGPDLAIVPVLQQLITELQPSLFISTGSAGGMGGVINCGDVAITSSARFRVNTHYPTYGQINTLSNSAQAISNTVAINGKYLSYAVENLTPLTLPSLGACYSQFQNRSGYSFLRKNSKAPAIYATDINPVPGPEPMAIVTADFLSADDSTNAEKLESLGIMNDNDDAYAFFAITQMPAAQQPAWISVRNASDPQVVAPAIAPGTSAAAVVKDLSAVAGAIFGVYEYVTTINSAFACWAVIAGNTTAAQTAATQHQAHNTGKSKATLTKATMATNTNTSNAIRIPITNVYGSGDYTAQIMVGSKKTPVNLILDTGSSTIAVQTTHYDPSTDTDLKPTDYAQEILYGTGGWIGPVVTTNISMGTAGTSATLQGAYLAIADDQLPNNFGPADGILGLAYNALNQAYNLTVYLQQEDINQTVTYPWPFNIPDTTAAYQQFMTTLNSLRYDDIPPYFDSLESAGYVANKFAFYTQRSFVSQATKTPETNPVNQGWFILGGGEEQTDLYTGAFQDVDVLDDLYYNVNLVSVQVGSGTVVKAAALPARWKQSAGSNAIIDSGTNTLAVSSDVWKAISAGLAHASSHFTALIKKGQTEGVPNSQIDMTKWPPIHFTFTSATQGTVVLTVPPQSYWQLDGFATGSAVFAIEYGGMPQSIFGLPLMNNYYCVFDRSEDSYGIIRFAPTKPL